MERGELSNKQQEMFQNSGFLGQNVTHCLLRSCSDHVRLKLLLPKIPSTFTSHQVHPTEAVYKDYKRSGDTFWSKLEPVKLDTAKLEHLFESKSKEMPVTKVRNQLLV